jgi:hypothetical protein
LECGYVHILADGGFVERFKERHATPLVWIHPNLNVTIFVTTIAAMPARWPEL